MAPLPGCRQLPTWSPTLTLQPLPSLLPPEGAPCRPGTLSPEGGAVSQLPMQQLSGIPESRATRGHCCVWEVTTWAASGGPYPMRCRSPLPAPQHQQGARPPPTAPQQAAAAGPGQARHRAPSHLPPEGQPVRSGLRHKDKTEEGEQNKAWGQAQPDRMCGQDRHGPGPQPGCCGAAWRSGTTHIPRGPVSGAGRALSHSPCSQQADPPVGLAPGGPVFSGQQLAWAHVPMGHS